MTRFTWGFYRKRSLLETVIAIGSDTQLVFTQISQRFTYPSSGIPGHA